MPDIIDLAQEAEALERAAALSAHVARRQGPGPVIVDGVACCLDCGCPIPAARLAALPDCSRCVQCQAELDGEG